MAFSTTAINGVGSTISFESFLAQITEFDGPEIGREDASDISVLDAETKGMTEVITDGDAYHKQKLPKKLVDPGKINCTIIFDSDDDPPIKAAASECIITWADLNTWTGDACLQNYAVQSVTDDVVTATCTVEFTGPITIATYVEPEE